VKQSNHYLLSSAGIGLLLLTFWTTLNAGDEDMSPSAYHVFDPETGYMVTVDPSDEEQQLPPASDDPPAEVKKTAPFPWQIWLVAIVVAGGVAVWLRKRPERHN
jgi:hypothetical protein